MTSNFIFPFAFTPLLFGRALVFVIAFGLGGTSFAQTSQIGATRPTEPLATSGRKFSADDQRLLDKAFDTYYGISRGPKRGQGLDLFRRAAATGDPVARFAFMNARLHRIGFRKKLSDEVIAEFARLLPYVEAQGQARDPTACYLLGETYEHGFGRQRSAALTNEWYARGAEAGHVLSARVHALSLERKARVNGEDLTEAARWFRVAAERGDELSASELGLMGLANPDLGISQLESVALIRRSAARNHPTGLLALAYIFENGKGVVRDEVEAFRTYRRALEAGDRRALGQLNRMYESGRADAEEMYLLGVMFRTRGPVGQNLKQSFTWYSRAAEQGHVLAAVERGWIATEPRG